MGEVQIRPLNRRGSELQRFLKLSYSIYRDDPFWVAPLLMDIKKIFLDANPFFQHAEMQLWIAERDGRDVGRIAGTIDRHYNEFHQEQTAFFGFFECVNDRTVSRALFAAATDWARGKGMNRMIGPLNPTTNEECGLLVDGFDSPPVLMMSYNPRYYADLITAEGFAKAKNLLAFAISLANTPMERFERIAAKVNGRAPDISITRVSRRHLKPALAQVKEIYNEAWRRNWGFVPMTDAEINFLATRLKPLLTEGLAYVATNSHSPREINSNRLPIALPASPISRGEPVGFLLAMPDFNQAIKSLKGRLLTPKFFGFLPYLLGWKVPKSCRVITLGVKHKYQGRGIESAMLTEGLRAGFKLGFRSVEASWILEDNVAVQRLIELFGGQAYKTYRIYERALHAPPS